MQNLKLKASVLAVLSAAAVARVASRVTLKVRSQLGPVIRTPQPPCVANSFPPTFELLESKLAPTANSSAWWVIARSGSFAFALKQLKFQRAWSDKHSGSGKYSVQEYIR